MRNDRRPFPEQTHFVGVLVPDELVKTLEGCRSYMREHYGCRSGQRTPIHVTLIPPFQATRGVDDQYLLDLMRFSLAPLQEEGNLPFLASVRGFGSFGDRTVFAHVEKDSRWSMLKKALEEEFVRNRVGDVKVEKKPFAPHLTVANRDIPNGQIGEILSHFSSLPMRFDFPVDTICLFVKNGNRWVVQQENCIVVKMSEFLK